jgi:hypothetical protein
MVNFMPSPPPGLDWSRGWVGPRAGLDAVEKRNKWFGPVGNRILIPRSSSPQPNAIPTRLGYPIPLFRILEMVFRGLYKVCSWDVTDGSRASFILRGSRPVCCAKQNEASTGHHRARKLSHRTSSQSDHVLLRRIASLCRISSQT